MSIEELKAKIAEKQRLLESMENTDEGYSDIETELEGLKTELTNLEKSKTETTDNANEDDEIEKIVQARLAKMKQNMDKMAEKNALLEKEKQDREQALKAEKMKRLEEEGKLQELAEMKVSEAEAQIKLLKEENIKLKRDQVVDSHLATLEFKNDRSRDMARRDIVDQLVQDDTGNWTHSSGKSITDFVVEYSKNSDNEFLFRVKANSGGGKTNAAGNSDTTKTKKLSDMTTAEVLDLAKKGQLGNFGY